jgi:GcrA cell cycle regulator
MNNNAVPSIWTDELIAELTKLWAEGYSAGVIAEQFGVTRNSVIGKVFRLNLISPEKKRVARQKVAAPKKVQRRDISKIVTMGAGQRIIRSSEAVDKYQLRCVEIAPRHLALVDLEPDDCRYPYGNETITFCGHPKMAGSSYCVPHKHLTSEPPRAPIHRFARVAA